MTAFAPIDHQKEMDVLAVLSLGFPADPIGRGKKDRKPLDQIAHRERWGTPFR
jgi:hypothetical protein